MIFCYFLSVCPYIGYTLNQTPGNTSHVGIECPLGDLAVRFHLDVLSQTANGLSS